MNRQLVLSLCFLGVLAGIAHQAPAATIVWTGAVDQDWFNTNSWSTLVAPTNGDDVFIDSSAALCSRNGILKNLT